MADLRNECLFPVRRHGCPKAPSGPLTLTLSHQWAEGNTSCRFGFFRLPRPASSADLTGRTAVAPRCRSDFLRNFHGIGNRNAGKTWISAQKTGGRGRNPVNALETRI